MAHNEALSLDEAAKATLKGIFFTKIGATLLSDSSTSLKGGSLAVSTEISLKANKKEPSIVAVVVKMEVKGIPKDAKDENALFAINIEAMGRYEWQTPIDVSLLDNENLTAYLANPVYVFTVPEVEKLALKLGIPGVKLDWSLPEYSKVVAPKKRSPAKKAVKQASS